MKVSFRFDGASNPIGTLRLRLIDHGIKPGLPFFLATIHPMPGLTYIHAWTTDEKPHPACHAEEVVFTGDHTMMRMERPDARAS